MCEEGCFPLVSWFVSHIVVSPSNVEFSEERAFCQAVDCLWYEGHGIAVLPCPFVNRAVVLYWSEFSIALLYEEEVGCIWAPGFSYSASFEMFLYKLAHFSLFCLREG